MDANRLFVHTLRDLEQRIAATDEYTILMSAALLRKLLLDQSNLLAQVNSRHRLKIRFRISDISPLEQAIHDQEPEFWIIEDSLDPNGPFAYRPYNATLDQFLKRRVLRFNNHWITVRDAIDHLVNIGGAVHSGSPRNERQGAIHSAEKFYSRAGLPGAVSQVRLIGRITANGLHDLRDAVIADGSATWASVDTARSVELNHDDDDTYS